MDFDLIWNFIKENYQFLGICLLTFINLLFTLFKKKVKVVDYAYASLLEVIPQFIIDAENQFGAGHGNDKLKFVCDKALEYLVSVTGSNIDTVAHKYGVTLVSYVEKVLSTPEKK